MTTSAIPVGLAFVGGLLTVLSPCVLPILPIDCRAIAPIPSLWSHDHGAGID